MNIADESGKRLAAIGVFIRGRDMGSAVEEMQRRVARTRHSLPPGYFATCGAASSRTSSGPWRGCELIVPISVFLIFLLLFHAFGSVKQRRADPR